MVCPNCSLFFSICISLQKLGLHDEEAEVTWDWNFSFSLKLQQYPLHFCVLGVSGWQIFKFIIILLFSLYLLHLCSIVLVEQSEHSFAKAHKMMELQEYTPKSFGLPLIHMGIAFSHFINFPNFRFTLQIDTDLIHNSLLLEKGNINSVWMFIHAPMWHKNVSLGKLTTTCPLFGGREL